MPSPPPRPLLVLATIVGLAAACTPGPGGAGDGGPDAAPSSSQGWSSEAPPLDTAPLPAPPPPGVTATGTAEGLAVPGPASSPRCPLGMVAVDGGAFCVDRWEASLVDRASGMALSPYYPPDRRLAAQLAATWETQRLSMGSNAARQIPLPPLPDWQTQRDVEPMAVSRAGAIPNGYVSGVLAERACRNAGKRLCRHEEWVHACEGEARRPFPYGDAYRQGACNIFRAQHPALELHDNPAIGHLDPRLNLVKDPDGDPLLRRTGATSGCKSAWGVDAAWDMNGNLDEWVDDEHGRFDGGFFSRSKRDGCASTVTAHPRTYFDYSTGVRCCWSREDGPAP